CPGLPQPSIRTERPLRTGPCAPSRPRGPPPSLPTRRKEGTMATELTYEEPRFAKWLFNSTAASWIWLVARVWLGYQWAHAGWEKITGTEAAHWYTWHFGYTTDSWMRSSSGLKGFAAYAATQSGKPFSAVNYGWYAAFLR